MEKLALRLPYYVHPATSGTEAPILLFLHGIGEGFDNGGSVSPANLFKQGPPKHLGALPLSHPLRRSFTMVAPQLPDRKTTWRAVAPNVKKIVDSHSSDGGKVYIFGFSKGGRGAFEIANTLNAAALVAVDAAPMGLTPADAIETLVRPLQQRPFWAIYTDYARDESHVTIQDFNDLLTPYTHDCLSSPPKAASQSRSCLKAPTGMSSNDRHVWICDEVTKSTAPYEWLLGH